MTYEVQFQIGAIQHTVRGPDPDGVLSLVNGLRAQVDTAPPKDPGQSTYERIWQQAITDLDGAMLLVQNNPEFFGARCGDDKIKVVGEFFVKWAAEKLSPDLWYPDDSGDWVEGHPRDLPPATRLTDWLFKNERQTKKYQRPAGHAAAGTATRPDIVAYKVRTP